MDASNVELCQSLARVENSLEDIRQQMALLERMATKIQQRGEDRLRLHVVKRSLGKHHYRLKKKTQLVANLRQRLVKSITAQIYHRYEELNSDTQVIRRQEHIKGIIKAKCVKTTLD